MKKALKFTFGTMLAVGLAQSAMANESDILRHGSVWVTGTYTESSNNGLSYGDLAQGPSPVLGFDGARRHVFIDNDMDFDYAVGLSYHFPQTHTRLFLTYDHYRDENSSNNSTIRNLAFSPSPASPTVASANVTHHADEVRLGLSHTLNFSRQFHFDLIGFFEWDSVSREMFEFISDSTGHGSRDTYNKVEGWGPGIGAMARTVPFKCYPHFGFFAGGTTTLLWSDNSFEETAFFGPAGVSSLLFDYDPEETDSMVGKIDISFGVNYCRHMRDFSNMVFDVALGVRYMNMFNVFKNGNTYSNPVYPGSNTVEYAANLGNPNDWGRVGPFLTIKLGGSHA